jgi:hypothetical protein
MLTRKVAALGENFLLFLFCHAGNNSSSAPILKRWMRLRTWGPATPTSQQATFVLTPTPAAHQKTPSPSAIPRRIVLDDMINGTMMTISQQASLAITSAKILVAVDIC